MNSRGLTIPLTLAISIISIAAIGGLGWGQMKERVDTLESKIKRQGDVQEKIIEMDKKQGVLGEKIESLTREQREFRRDTRQALDRILSILPSSGRRD